MSLPTQCAFWSARDADCSAVSRALFTQSAIPRRGHVVMCESVYRCLNSALGVMHVSKKLPILYVLPRKAQSHFEGPTFV